MQVQEVLRHVHPIDTPSLDVDLYVPGFLLLEEPADLLGHFVGKHFHTGTSTHLQPIRSSLGALESCGYFKVYD